MQDNKYIYVADIGGTNARFALAKQNIHQQFDIEHVKIFQCSEFSTFTDAFIAYSSYLTNDIKLKELPQDACIAIAAIIEQDSVQMTSINWSFSKTQLKTDLKLNELEVINDFASLAMSVPFIPDEFLYTVKNGEPVEGKPRVILGPGTGLGTASLIPVANKWIPIAAQGGHVNFSPVTPTEQSLLSIFKPHYEHVSFETFVCGRGLSNIYQGLMALHNDQDLSESPSLKPSSITQKAADQSDPIAVEALELFFSFLGRFAGNVALTCGSTGGIYLAGGILPRIKDLLKASGFNNEFVSKGVSSSFVDDIPIFLLDHPQPALIGSAAYFYQAHSH